MMAKVMLPQKIADPVLHRKMMNGVMHHVVTEISGDEPGKEGIHEPRAAYDFEQEEENNGERNTDRGRHDKAA